MPTTVGELTRGAVFAKLIELGALGVDAGTAVTISGDDLELTLDKALYIVDGEGGANDELHGINISAGNEGQIVFLRAANGRTITVKDEGANAAAGEDKIRLPGAADHTFTDDSTIMFYHDPDLDRWVYLGGGTDTSGGGGHTEDHDHDGTSTQKLLAVNTHESVATDTHHAQSHSLASHSSEAHSELTGIGATDHHSNANDHVEAHSLASHSSEAHSELSGVGVDNHHNQAHDLLSTPHGDTIASGALQGSIIVVNSAGKWFQVSLGASGFVLKSDGTNTLWGQLAHSDLTDAPVNAHHAQSHSLASHSSEAHSELSGIGATDHHSNASDHAQSHSLASHSSEAHSELTGVTADQHHVESHSLASHSSEAHSELTGVGSNDHHAQLHAAAHKDGGADELGIEELATAGADGQIAKAQGGGAVAMEDDIKTLVVHIDGGGSVITTGKKIRIRAYYAFTILEWTIVSDASGSIVVDVNRATNIASYPTVSSIAGTNKPTLSSAQDAEDTDLTTGWGDDTIDAGNILEFEVDSATTVKQVTITFKIKKT